MIMVEEAMMTGLEPIEAELVGEGLTLETAADEDAGDRLELAERYAMLWLHGFTNTKTTQAYARAIGMSADKRGLLPGAPKAPQPPSELAWIPWALEHGVTPYGDLEVVEVQSWLHALKSKTDKKNTRRQYFGALCSFYRSLRRQKVTSCDPDDLIDRDTMGLQGVGASLTQKLDPNQVRALFIAARLEGGQDRERDLAVIAVLAATGCRADELCQLDDDHYTRTSANGPAWLRLHGKGDKERWQKLPAADAELLDQYLATRTDPETSTDLARRGEVSNRPSRALFRGRLGNRLDPDTIRPMLRRVANRPRPDDPRQSVRWAEQQLRGIRNTLHPHQFRHSYTVTAHRNGIPVKQIQADLGHASLTSTQIYLDGADTVDNSAAQTVSDIYHAGEASLLSNGTPQ